MIFLNDSHGIHGVPLYEPLAIPYLRKTDKWDVVMTCRTQSTVSTLSLDDGKLTLEYRL